MQDEWRQSERRSERLPLAGNIVASVCFGSKADIRRGLNDRPISARSERSADGSSGRLAAVRRKCERAAAYWPSRREADELLAANSCHLRAHDIVSILS